MLNQLDFKEAIPPPVGRGIVMLIAAAKGVDAWEDSSKKPALGKRQLLTTGKEKSETEKSVVN